jgi:hypothetical protein
MDKPTDHVGDSTLYVACTEPAPEGHHTFLPIDPHGLKSHEDPDATMWGANNGLAPYSDRPFTLSALASHWSASEPQWPTQSRRLQAPGEPHWSLLCARKVISRLRLLVSELVCTSSDCRGRLVSLEERLVRWLPEISSPIRHTHAGTCLSSVRHRQG